MEQEVHNRQSVRGFGYCKLWKDFITGAPIQNYRSLKSRIPDRPQLVSLLLAIVAFVDSVFRFRLRRTVSVASWAGDRKIRLSMHAT